MQEEKTRFEIDNRLAIHTESEMTRLNDPCMNGADSYLVDPFTLHLLEWGLPAKTGAAADAEGPDDVKVLDRKGREFHARKGSPNANAWQGKETNAAPYPPASKPVQIHRNPATQICNVG